MAPRPDDERSRLISLASLTVDVTAPPEVPAALQAPDEGYYLVKYPGPITARQREALAAAVDRVYVYLPYDTFLVRASRMPGRPGSREVPGALWIGPYHPAYKIAPAVAAAAEAPAHVEAADDRARIVMLLVYPDADLAAVRHAVDALAPGRTVGARLNPFFSRIRLLLTDGEVATAREALARIPGVFWVDIEGRKALLNDTTIWVGQSGVSGGQATPVFAHGIHGEGQVVGIIDTGIDADMCYFRDTVNGLPPRNECDAGTVVNPAERKVLAVDFLWTNECAGGITNTEWDTLGHGTHVAGTVAGDNFANPIGHDPGDGMAPGARLVIQDAGYQVDNCADLPALGCPVVDLNPFFQQAYTQGARLHTNSYGDNENAPIQNNYTAASQDVDEFMWNHKDFQIFFAAGNSGPAAGSVGSPSTAKNVVSVGATLRGTSAETMASFSSCGPTDDNRIKPDLTIPGTSIISAGNDGNVGTNNCGEATMSGTSMASPAAAGFGALARQYFTDGFYPSGVATPADAFAPSSALVKATLLNSAQNMTGVAQPIPSNCQGWGRILLDNALYFPGDARRLWVKDDTVGFPTGSSGETRTFAFAVNSGSVPFKATVVWTDFPSTPAANPHLNNDLDLEVVGPGGTFKGNVFSGGQSVTGGVADRRNTAEQVLLLSPTPGAYTVTVRSFTVPNGPQPFALVVTGDVTVTAAPVALSINDVSVTEGNAGTTTATFTVTLNPAAAQTVTVDFATADGTATTADNDYVAASGTVTFPAGQTTQPVAVTVNGDTVFEPDETFFVNLSSPVNATIADGQGVGTILNDDGPPGANFVSELFHGFNELENLAAVGGVQNLDYYRLSQKPYSSYEVLVDATSGDIGNGFPLQPLNVERMAPDGTTVIAHSFPVSPLAFSRWMPIINIGSAEVNNQTVRVRSGGCTTDCGPDDVYQIHFFETTYSIPRFNNSGTQITVLVLQNPTEYPINTVVVFWDSGGNQAFLEPVGVSPKQTQVLNTATFISGSGSITVAHDGRYGDLSGKTVALEPATGFSFDSPMLPRVK